MCWGNMWLTPSFYCFSHFSFLYTGITMAEGQREQREKRQGGSRLQVLASQRNWYFLCCNVFPLKVAFFSFSWESSNSPGLSHGLRGQGLRQPMASVLCTHLGLWETSVPPFLNMLWGCWPSMQHTVPSSTVRRLASYCHTLDFRAIP